MKVALCIIFCLISITACILPHPKYQSEINIPEHWRFDADESCFDPNLAWWQQFGDPLLDRLIHQALENNPDIKLAAARVAQFYGQLGVARSFLYPELDALGSASRQESSLFVMPTFPGLNRITNLYQTFLSLTYDLDLFGRIRSSAAAAYHDLLAQESLERAVWITLISNVAASYIELRQLDEQLIISKLTLKTRQDAYDIALLRFQGGLTSEIEAKQALSEVEGAQTRIVGFELQIAQQENLLSVLLGESPHAIPRGLSLNEFQTPFTIPIGLPADLLENRPDIQQAEQDLLAAGFRVSEAKAAYFPDITLTGNYGNASTQLHKLFTGPARSWTYGINLFETLFTGWRTENQVEVEKSIQLEALYSYEQTILNALKEVNNALIAYQKANELLVIEQSLVNTLTDYRHLAQIQYDNGETDYLNVLDAEQKLFNAQLDFVAVQGDIYLSLVTLFKALGGGW